MRNQLRLWEKDVAFIFRGLAGNVLWQWPKENGLGFWWAYLFLWRSLVEGLMRGTDKCLYFPQAAIFSAPLQCPSSLKADGKKEMKLITRSQLRRVIGKVCSNGSLWDVCPCGSCRYSADEAKGGEDYESSAQEAISRQPEEEFESGNRDEEEGTPSTREDSINIYLYRYACRKHIKYMLHWIIYGYLSTDENPRPESCFYGLQFADWGTMTCKYMIFMLKLPAYLENDYAWKLYKWDGID